jgi:hypothetical protein
LPIEDWPEELLAQHAPGEPASVVRMPNGQIIYSAHLKAKLKKPIADYDPDSDELFDELTALAEAERQ